MTAPARKLRPRRIASDEAHAWARNLRLANPFAKLTLTMLTGYVNGDGVCIVGIETLAEDTELSTDTVRKRLAWLEQIGAIVRFPNWIDGNGKRNTEARGRRTSDEIRLLMDADIEAIEARAAGETVAESHDADPRCQQGSDHETEAAGPRPALGQPSHCSEGLTSEPEPEDSPQAPLRGDEADDADAPEGSDPDGWPEFKSAFESDGKPILKIRLAKQIVAALTPDERTLATRAARGLIAMRAREKKPGMKPAAQGFLREPEAWPGFAAHCPPDPVRRPDPVFIAEGSEEWKAMIVIDAICGYPPTEAKEIPNHGRGRLRPSALTLQHIALARFASDDPEKWDIVDEGSNECGAWKRFLGAEARKIKIGTKSYEVSPGKIVDDWPIYKIGLRVPQPFPPRKDGSLGLPESSAA